MVESLGIAVDLLYQWRRQFREKGEIAFPGQGNVALTKSIFHTLKTQSTHHERFSDKNEAVLTLFNYIEAYYNRRRRHSPIGYRTPAEFEQYVESLQSVAELHVHHFVEGSKQLEPPLRYE